MINKLVRLAVLGLVAVVHDSQELSAKLGVKLVVGAAAL